jgi:hypothetical protein
MILDVGALLRAAQRQPAGTLRCAGGCVGYELRAPWNEIRVEYAASGECVDCDVDLVTDEATFGTRTWFACPDCDRRCRKLYVAPNSTRLSCRCCLGLAYKSQLLDPMRRARNRAVDLRARLGCAASLTEPLPEKRPRGMWRRTYWRRLAAAAAADAKFWRELAKRFA